MKGEGERKFYRWIKGMKVDENGFVYLSIADFCL